MMNCTDFTKMLHQIIFSHKSVNENVNLELSGKLQCNSSFAKQEVHGYVASGFFDVWYWSY